MKSAKVELKPDPANPNRLDPSDKKRMARSLDEFGDLSGVVLNRRTGLLVGGHQRVDVLAGADVQAEDLPAPEPDGTVARGWLVRGGKRYAGVEAGERFGRLDTRAENDGFSHPEGRDAQVAWGQAASVRRRS